MPRRLFYDLSLVAGILLCGGVGIWLAVRYFTSGVRSHALIGGGLLVGAGVFTAMFVWSLRKNKDEGTLRIGE